MLAVIPFAIVGVCALPWVMFASRRFGHLFGVPAVDAVAVLILLATIVLGRFTGAGILISIGTIVIAGGVVGGVLATRAGAWRLPGRHALAVWVPVLLGGAAWVITLAIAKVLPGAAPLSWALNGDATNNLHFAGLIIERNGVALGGAENPVPLTAALLALGIAPGRPTGDPAAMLAHDFAGFGAVWVRLLAATALGMGAVAASIIKRSRIGLVAVASRRIAAAAHLVREGLCNPMPRADFGQVTGQRRRDSPARIRHLPAAPFHSRCRNAHGARTNCSAKSEHSPVT